MATVAVTGVTRALRDKLSELEDSVQKLEAANKIKYAPAEDLGALQDHIFDRQNDHERTISALRRDLGQLRATLENQTCELSQLRQLVDALTDGVLTERADDHIPAAPVVKTEHEEQTSQRDNLYNNAVRSAFLVALGLPFSARYNDLATIPSTANGGAWVELRAEVAGEKATRVLRPDFAKPWTQNALGWRVELIGFVRAKVPQLQPLFNNAFMKSKTDDEISSKLSALYKTLKSKHNKLTAYGTSAPTTSSAVTPPSTEANTAQSARRLARKKRKSQGRRKVLLDPQVYDQDSVASEWRWLVDEPAYMSTDESTDDEQDQQVGVIDPNSDDERKPRTRKQIPWITRPPTYRNAILQQTIDDMDAHIANQPLTSGTASHPRISGAPKDVPLPKLFRKSHAVRIPLAAVDWTWLDGHRAEVVGLRDEDASEVRQRWLEGQALGAEVEVDEGAGDNTVEQGEQGVDGLGDPALFS